MWGVGPKAAEKLRSVGLRTLGDLANASPKRLSSVVGSSWGAAIGDLARGLDPREVMPGREAISIGAEETYETDLSTPDQIELALLSHASRIAKRLAATRQAARTITLKLKLPDFTLVTRRVTLPEPLADTTSIHRTACELLRKLGWVAPRVRLTGISASNLVGEEEEQATLFPDAAANKRRQLEKALLEVRGRFGDSAVRPAGLAGEVPRGTNSPNRRVPPR